MSQNEISMIEESARQAAKTAHIARKQFAAGKCSGAVAEYWQGRADALVKLVAVLAVSAGVTHG